MTALRDAALDYARSGYEVFPLRGKLPFANCRECNPASERYQPHDPGHCTHLLCHGLYAATSSEERVTRWWRWRPQANIGCRVPEALMVLDVDPRHGGDERLAALQAEHGPLPRTRTSYSGRGDGGRHLWFLHPGGSPTARLLGDGLDVKDRRGYVILPPSRHPDTGGAYRWDEPVAEPARVPGWLRCLLCPPPPPSIPRFAPRRPGRAAELAGWLLHQPEGNRNAGLFWAATRALEAGCDDAGLEPLVEAAAQVGLPEVEARRVIQSARRRAGGVR